MCLPDDMPDRRRRRRKLDKGPVGGTEVGDNSGVGGLVVHI